MPIVIIIVGLAVAVGVGGYFLRPQTPETSEAVEVTPQEAAPEAIPDTRDAETVPTETGDDALSNPSVPEESGDYPTSATESATSAYADGSYNIATSYFAPNRANHTVDVAFTITNDIVTAAKISFGGDDVATSKGYQAKFVAAYESQVIGKKLDNISLSRVGGASLTSNAFNDAIAKVKVAAQN